MRNSMKLELSALPENESFARVAVAAFMAELDPTIDEMEDVKTAVSEAVTNCIIHGYEMTEDKLARLRQDKETEIPFVRIECMLQGRHLHITVTDNGVGIEDIEKAMQPLYTSKPELDRSGMGFVFMDAFMDEMSVESEPGKGTKVCMKKKIGEES